MYGTQVRYSDIDVVWIDVPVPLIPAFSEVIRGGMAFERGQPPELYAFAEKIQQIAQKQAEAQSKLLEAPSEPMFMYGILVPP